MLLDWAAVTALVGYPYVEKVEKLRSSRERFFSYFALAVGGFIAGLAEKVLKKKKKIKGNYGESYSSFLSIVMWDEKRFGREMFQNEPIVKNLTSFSRNTTPYVYILYYIYLLSHEKSGFMQNVQKIKKNLCKSTK